MPARRSVLVIRADPAARRTAALLAARGFAPFVLPLSAVLPVVDAAFPDIGSDKSFDAVIATSANAFLQPLPRHAAFLARLPLYCVGRRTAQAARENGFTSIAAIAKNADTLCAEIQADKNKRFIYLAGRLRRPVLEHYLRCAGAQVVSVEVYETKPLAPTAAERAGLPRAVDFILLYSAASAGMIASLADAITPATRILCLSGRIASALPGGLRGHVLVAGEPTEKALMSLLHR